MTKWMGIFVLFFSFPLMFVFFKFILTTMITRLYYISYVFNIII